MRRLLFVATSVFFIVATLLPTQRTFVVSAVTEGERLSMYSKPAVVRIVDGAVGQYMLQLPNDQLRTFNVSSISLGSGFFISSNGYIATNAHVVSTTKEGEQKTKEVLFWQMVQQIAQALNRDPRTFSRSDINQLNQYSELQNFQKVTT